MMAIVSGDPSNVQDHLLILLSWKEQFNNFFDKFCLVEFWVQIWGLSAEWYSERVGRKYWATYGIVQRWSCANNGI